MDQSSYYSQIIPFTLAEYEAEKYLLFSNEEKLLGLLCFFL